MQKRFKILLATDYSEAALNAERYAVEFAKNTNSEIKIIHAYEIPLSYTPAKPIEFSKSRDDFQKSELKRLKQHFEKLLQSVNIKPDDLNHQCEVREGSAAGTISEDAEVWYPDFIIVGTHGVSGFREVLFGTHTWELIKKSGFPVLAIPINAEFKKLKNIVFAIEQRDGEIPAIQFLIKLAAEFKANLTVLHVANNVVTKEVETVMFNDFMKDVNVHPSSKQLKSELYYHDDTLEGLNEYCSKNQAEWLVVSHEEPSLLERIVMQDYSTTQKISFKTHIPLLSIPDYYNPDNASFWNMFDIDNK
ncbi:MAG: universal stress protein [Bacteroidia bacterium]